MPELEIIWQRLLDDAGATCPRCGSTGDAVARAAADLERALAPLGISVTVTARALTDEQFRADPAESNRIWIGGRPLEEWLDARTGSSRCCDQCGDDPCRTIEVGGVALEAIPAQVIVQAGLLAAASLVAAAAGANYAETGPSPPG